MASKRACHKETKREAMGAVETDKENNVVGTLREKGPATPTQLLKRTRSTLLPKKNGQRQPLASKDKNYNRSSSYLSLKRNSNQKKLKPAVTRAGSTANNANRRVTSLILKDIASGDEKESASESDSEDDEESNPLALKIKQALTHSIASAEGKTGLLNGKSGLRKIFNDRDLDREIEVASVREPEKPYEPEGYEPLDDSDLEKLKLKNAINRPTFIMDSPRAISIVGDDSPQLLPLDLEESKLGEGVLNDKNTTDEVITRANTQAKNANITESIDDCSSVEIDSIYDGRGLDEQELLDLLD